MCASRAHPSYHESLKQLQVLSQAFAKSAMRPAVQVPLWVSASPHQPTIALCKQRRRRLSPVCLAANSTVHTTQRLLTMPPILPEDALLRTWIETHGGHISSALRLVQEAPCGCRGVISIQDFSVAEQEALPPVIIPESLYLTSAAARAQLGPKLHAAGLQPIHSLPVLHQTALMLAAERVKGEHSFWHPYIVSLPSRAPCGWMLSRVELDVTLDALRMQLQAHAQQQRDESQRSQAAGLPFTNNVSQSIVSLLRSWLNPLKRSPAQKKHDPHDSWVSSSSARQSLPLSGIGSSSFEQAQLLHLWRSEAGNAQRLMEERANRLARMYGRLLGVHEDDVLWALGQVVSRAFGSGDNVGMAPYIDLCNHKAGHQRPTPCDLSAEATEADACDDSNSTSSKGTFSAVGSSGGAGSVPGASSVVFWIANAQDGQVQHMQAGDELYISYVAKCTPLQAWLSFGFVPPELVGRMLAP